MRFTLWLTDSQAKRLEHLAKVTNRSRGAVLRVLLNLADLSGAPDLTLNPASWLAGEGAPCEADLEGNADCGLEGK